MEWIFYFVCWYLMGIIPSIYYLNSQHRSYKRGNDSEYVTKKDVAIELFDSVCGPVSGIFKIIFGVELEFTNREWLLEPITGVTMDKHDNFLEEAKKRLKDFKSIYGKLSDQQRKEFDTWAEPDGALINPHPKSCLTKEIVSNSIRETNGKS